MKIVNGGCASFVAQLILLIQNGIEQNKYIVVFLSTNDQNSTKLIRTARMIRTLCLLKQKILIINKM